ncbi:MAG: RNA polymerase factor sigma-54 [Opitutales bacterium]
MSSQGLHQVQRQSQSLILAPQLRQSLKILQAPALDLRNAILEELQSNPTLEELPLEGMSLEQETGERTSSPDDASDAGDGSDVGSDVSDDRSENTNGEEMDFSEDFKILQQLDEDWREHFAQESKQNVYTNEDAERRQHFFDSLVSETSLQEHLIRQAELTEMVNGEREALDYLIGSIDDNGFMTSSLSDIALMSNLPLKTIQDASEILKTLEPPGIGAANLKECLLLQLKQHKREKTLAARIIREHFELLLRRRIPDIARKTGASIREVEESLEEIATLDPAPGRKFGEDSNRIIVPDVTVEKDGDNWQITLNNDYIPRLRLSNTYKEMIARGRLSSKEKEYVREKMRSGKFLISSIEQRQQTIERITRELLQFQQDFFEHGVSKLRPLTMSQVAERVGVHETTISRAIANKYIDTPHGIYEFKYFFTPGYTNKAGESVSNTTIKEEIADIIENENPAKPYSDQDIVRLLAEKDIKIARRTVAKYREELGILPTNLRRRYR